MWSECACGHLLSAHFWDATKLRNTFCETCVRCGRKERDHNPHAHDFERCVCSEYREAA